MLKFLAGLLLGLAIGGVYFYYQVKKVDYYSNRVGYILGRFDENADPLQDTRIVGCRVYLKFNLDTPPFGYSSTSRDAELKDFCQTLSQSQEREQ